MRSKAEKFYAREIGDEPPFRRWQFRRLVARKREWRARASTVYVWINALEGKLTNVEVHSGSNMMLRRRGNRRSRARRLLFYLTLPPYRNYTARSVKELVVNARTLAEKCEVGSRYALARGLTFGIVPELARRVEDRGVSVDARYLLISRNASSGTSS